MPKKRTTKPPDYSERITRICRKLEIIWLHVPNSSFARLVSDLTGDWKTTKPTDLQFEARLNEILATVNGGEVDGNKE